jgi:hypothetical protein
LNVNEDGDRFNRAYLQEALSVPQYPLIVKIKSLVACDFINSKFIKSGDFIARTFAHNPEISLSNLNPETSNLAHIFNSIAFPKPRSQLLN